MRAAYLDPHAPRVHLLLGRAQRRRGDREKAVSELRMSLWCRDDEAVRMELALLLKEMGREAEARTEARRVLETDPANEAARKLAGLRSPDQTRSSRRWPSVPRASARYDKT